MSAGRPERPLETRRSSGPAGTSTTVPLDTLFAELTGVSVRAHGPKPEIHLLEGDMRKPLCPLTGLILLGILRVAEAHAQRPVVNQVPDLAPRLLAIKKIAIAPVPVCPAALDCGRVEQELFTRVFEKRARSPWKPAVVSADKMRQKMFELGVDDLSTPEHRAKLAEALGVELILLAAVPYLDSRSQPQSLFTPAGNAPEARVELTLYSFGSDAPPLLFRGSNQAIATTWNQAEGLVARLLKELVDRFFPKE